MSPRHGIDPAKTRAQIAGYLAKQKPAARRALKLMRRVIRQSAPGVVEVFSYGIPGFRHDGQAFLWYAGWAEHTSLYPVGPRLRRTLGPQAMKLEGSRGTIRFPIDRPPSAAFVKRIVKARLGELR